MRKLLIAGVALVACLFAGCASKGKRGDWEDRSSFVGGELDKFFVPVDRASKTAIMIEPDS